MSIKYKTILCEAEEMIVIEKSKFIATIKPVETQEEAEEFIAMVKKRHKDATHNVPVYLIGEKFDIQRYSDDGEPSGTAGVPVIQMLMKEGITNIALVITRYFGGIKLGTGGLVRAYTNSAKEGLKFADVAEAKDMCVMSIEIDYTYHGKIENLASTENFIINNVDFSHVVTLEITIDPQNIDIIKKLFMEHTNGTCKIIKEEIVLVKVKVGY